jgi:hypothetical protein
MVLYIIEKCRTQKTLTPKYSGCKIPQLCMSVYVYQADSKLNDKDSVYFSETAVLNPTWTQIASEDFSVLICHETFTPSHNSSVAKRMQYLKACCKWCRYLRILARR